MQINLHPDLLTLIHSPIRKHTCLPTNTYTERCELFVLCNSRFVFLPIAHSEMKESAALYRRGNCQQPLRPRKILFFLSTKGRVAASALCREECSASARKGRAREIMS